MFTRVRGGRGGLGEEETTNKGRKSIERDGYKVAPCSRLLRLDRIGFQRCFVRGFIFHPPGTNNSISSPPFVRSNE